MIDRSCNHGLAALVIMVCGAFPALAEGGESCPYQPALHNAATFLLAEPADNPDLWRDQHGDDAAYLAIRHGGMEPVAAEELIATLEARSHAPRRIRELALAHAGKEERMARIAELAPQARQASILLELGYSVLWALVEHDGGDWLVDELARWRAADADNFGGGGLFQNLALTIAELDDARKADLAQKAEQADLWRLAIAVSAMRDDFSSLLERLERLPREHWRAGVDEAGNRRIWIATSLGLAELNPRFDPAALDEAVAMLTEAVDWRPARTRAHELMLDLDRRCGHALAPILPMMEAIYRFEAR